MLRDGEKEWGWGGERVGKGWVLTVVVAEGGAAPSACLQLRGPAPTIQNSLLSHCVLKTSRGNPFRSEDKWTGTARRAADHLDGRGPLRPRSGGRPTLQLILCPGRGRYPPVRRHNPRRELDGRQPAMRRDDCLGFEVHRSGSCDQRQARLLCGGRAGGAGQPTGTGRRGTGTTASSTRLSSGPRMECSCTPQKAGGGGGMCRRAPHRGCLQGCARRPAAGLSPASSAILCRSLARRGRRRRRPCARASGSAAALRPPTTFASTPRCTQTTDRGRLRRAAIGAPTKWGRVCRTVRRHGVRC